MIPSDVYSHEKKVQIFFNVAHTMLNTEPKEIWSLSFLGLNMVALSYVFYMFVSHD